MVSLFATTIDCSRFASSRFAPLDQMPQTGCDNTRRSSSEAGTPAAIRGDHLLLDRLVLAPPVLK